MTLQASLGKFRMARAPQLFTKSRFYSNQWTDFDLKLCVRLKAKRSKNFTGGDPEHNRQVVLRFRVRRYRFIR